MPGVVTVTLNPAIDVSTSVHRIAPEDKLRCDAERRDPGGGGVNVARVIRRLGGDVLALYLAGGFTGLLLDEYMAAEGVHTQTIVIDGVTRESFTITERSSGKEFRFILPGPAIAHGAFQRLLAALEAISPPPAYVVCSGSLPPGASEDAYAQIARAAVRRGAKVALDASGAALRIAVENGVYLLKPSLRELESLAGLALADAAAAVSAARKIVDDRRADVVVVTMGAKGAALVTATRSMVAEALPVPVTSSVGAGDSFFGAMICSLTRGEDLVDAFRYGVAASAASLLAPGTQLCSREDVMRLATEVRLRDLHS